MARCNRCEGPLPKKPVVISFERGPLPLADPVEVCIECGWVVFGEASPLSKALGTPTITREVARDMAERISWLLPFPSGRSNHNYEGNAQRASIQHIAEAILAGVDGRFSWCWVCCAFHTKHEAEHHAEQHRFMLWLLKNAGNDPEWWSIVPCPVCRCNMRPIWTGKLEHCIGDERRACPVGEE